MPGHTLYQLLHAAPVPVPATGTDLMTNLVLGTPSGTSGTQVQQALARQPSLIYLWVGGDDALPALPTGDPMQMTPVSTFTAEFADVLAALGTSHARLVVANVPDVTKIPYMTSATALLDLFSKVTGFPSFLFSDVLHIYPGDLVNAQGITDLEADLMKAENFELPPPLPASDILTAANVAIVQNTIDGYNAAIAKQVAAAGGTVVDMHTLINNWAANGITINGYAATMNFLGGVFGIDGIHPTNTGYALLANQFITATNSALGTAVAPVNVSAVAAKDPLFGPDTNTPLKNLSRPPALPAVPVVREAEAILFGQE